MKEPTVFWQPIGSLPANAGNVAFDTNLVTKADYKILVPPKQGPMPKPPVRKGGKRGK